MNLWIGGESIKEIPWTVNNFKKESMNPLKILVLFFSPMILSCGNQQNKKQVLPNFDLALEFGSNSLELEYQYYQKFGFTDLCEDIRMIGTPSKAPILIKKLPLEPNDLKIINSFQNKVDKLGGDRVLFPKNLRNIFLDIELDFIEFGRDELPNISLKLGTYEITQKENQLVLKIYNYNFLLL